MAIIKNKNTEENRQFWSHVEAVAKEVRTWPKWMSNRDAQQMCQAKESEPPESTNEEESHSE
jgi:hypothetical protein